MIMGNAPEVLRTPLETIGILPRISAGNRSKMGAPQNDAYASLEHKGQITTT